MSYVSEDVRVFDTSTILSILCDESDDGIQYFPTSKNRDMDFDEVVGHIEDILMEDEFQTLQKRFMEKHWKEFDDKAENKLIYTQIFNDYIKIIEKYIENELKKKIPNFNMEEFTTKIMEQSQHEPLEGEVFEILATFSDFIAFREMFSDYREYKEGRSLDLSAGILVSSLPKLDVSQIIKRN